MNLSKFFRNSILTISVLSLATCSADKSADNKTADAQEVAEKIENEQFSGERKSKAAAQHYFKKMAGIELDNILPDYDYDCQPEDKWFYGEERNALAAFYKTNSLELSRDEYKAYVKKVYEATKKVADEGINIYGFEKKDKQEEALSELSLDQLFANDEKAIIYLGMYSWSYRLNGTMLTVSMTLDQTRGDQPKYYARVQIYPGLTKSFDETLKDAEKALEREDVQEAIKDYVNK